MDRINAALIGSGNIGTDLMYKALRSRWLQPVWMVGIDSASDGLARARAAGLATTSAGLEGLLPHLERDRIRIAFDATSAQVHPRNAARLAERGVVMVDLTPAAIGPYCVPPVNLAEQVGKRAMNVNMVSCGGQATIPIVAAVARVQPVAYAEIVATVAPRSAGPGTRPNIDEVTRTTANGIEQGGGAKRGTAIVSLNPPEPPRNKRDTVQGLT
jgi:acetaldehyde/propanal dehydrogenase